MTQISPYADDNAKFNEERTFNDAAPTTSDELLAVAKANTEFSYTCDGCFCRCITP